VFTITTMKSTGFWDVMQRSMLQVHWSFRGLYRLHLKGQRVSQASKHIVLMRMTMCGCHVKISLPLYSAYIWYFNNFLITDCTECTNWQFDYYIKLIKTTYFSLADHFQSYTYKSLIYYALLRFEVFMAKTINNSIFWDVMQFGFC
jgi:hypothetical protein